MTTPIKPSKSEETRLRAEAERLVKSGKMPPLEAVLKAVEEAREFVRAKRVKIH